MHKRLLLVQPEINLLTGIAQRRVAIQLGDFLHLANPMIDFMLQFVQEGSVLDVVTNRFHGGLAALIDTFCERLLDNGMQGKRDGRDLIVALQMQQGELQLGKLFLRQWNTYLSRQYDASF